MTAHLSRDESAELQRVRALIGEYENREDQNAILGIMAFQLSVISLRLGQIVELMDRAETIALQR